MKYLGIDYGTRNIGIALSNPEGTIAFPRTTLDSASAMDSIAEIVEREGVEAIVMGDTRSYGNVENAITKKADAFADKLAERLGMPVRKAYEVATSVEARQFAPERSGHDDAAAAAVILQRYLDMRGGSS